MFVVKDTLEEREKKIRDFAEQEPCVGVFVAAVNLEWALRRCILSMGTTSTTILNLSKEEWERLPKETRPSRQKIIDSCSSLHAYADLWRRELRGAASLQTLMNEEIQCPSEWKTRKLNALRDPKSGWEVLQYAYILRNKIFHGAAIGVNERYAKQVIEVYLAAVSALSHFADQNNAPIFGRIIRRPNPFVFK